MRRLVVLATCTGVVLLACHNTVDDKPSRATTADPVPTAINPIPAAPAPTPKPTSTPNPIPPPDPTPPPSGGGADIPNNTNPVARADAKVDGVLCNGQLQPVSYRVPVGCILRLDVTPFDGSGQATQTKNSPVWTYSNTSFWVGHGGSAFNPLLLGVAPGTTGVYCTVDGIQSNSFSISFY